MAFTAFRTMKPLSQFMFSIFVIIISFLAFMILSMGLAIPLFGLDSMLSIPTIGDLNDPGSIRILKYFQVVQIDFLRNQVNSFIILFLQLAC